MTDDVRDIPSTEDPAAEVEAPDGTEPKWPSLWTRVTAGDLRRAVVPALAGTVVFLAALAIVFAVLWQTADPTPAETRADVARFLASNEAAAADTAAEVLGLLLNYDSTTLDEVADRMLEVSTGGFKDDYDEFIGEGFGEALKEVAASSRGQILSEPAVSFTSVSEATVIARVEQTTQSTGNPEGKTFTYVLELTLVDTRDGWKADQVQILSGEETG